MTSPSSILDRVTIRLIDTADERRRWDHLIATEHYLQSARMVGEQLRYVAAVDDQWLGLVGWSAATMSSASRRHWIGWTLSQERQRLHLIAQNARFLIRGSERIPNLASRILGLCTARLRRDWRRAYAHDIVIIETFVDPSRYQGTCYRAAGWTLMGRTRGARRYHETSLESAQPKLMLMKEIAPRARERLCADHHLEDRGAFLTIHEIAIAGPEGLLSYLRLHLPDPRSRRGRSFQFASIMGILAAGILTGHSGIEGIAAWAKSLDQATLELFFCPRGPDGRWKSPCANSFRYMMKDLDPQALERTLSGWLRQRGLFRGTSGLSIGARRHPAPSAVGRPCPWHIRWTKKEPRRTSRTPVTNAGSAAVASAEPMVTL